LTNAQKKRRDIPPGQVSGHQKHREAQRGQVELAKTPGEMNMKCDNGNTRSRLHPIVADGHDTLQAKPSGGADIRSTSFNAPSEGVFSFPVRWLGISSSDTSDLTQGVR